MTANPLRRWSSTLLFGASLGSLVAMAYPAARPTAKVVVTCAAGSRQCAFSGRRSLNAVSYRWSFGTGQPDERRDSVTNTFPAGSWCVRLVVYGSAGDSSYATKLITVPTTSAASFRACPKTTKPPVPPVVPPAPVTPPPVVTPPTPAPSGEAWAELPRVYLDTKMPATTGKVISVPVGGDLQAALNSAQPGDAIELANAGTWSGTFTLPNKTGAGWIVIRPANMTVLPPEGSRLSPAKAGRLPVILATSNAGAIVTDPGAHHWRLIGLEVSIPSTIATTGLIRLGTGYETTLAQMPHDLVLDRMYVHGTATGIVRRAIVLNGASQSVIDSYVSECHDYGPDSQAIAGWNGPGPFKIVNNYLEAASENINWGGADPTIQGLIPSDIEIRRNHMTKRLAWKGLGYNVKNLFEVKNAQRVLVEGNVFESNWADGQGGSAIVLKSVNQSKGCPWCVAKDITFRLNVIRNTGSGFALTGHDVGAQSIMTRVTITDNLLTAIDQPNFAGDGRAFLINNDPIDLVIAHNTALDVTNTAITFGGPDTLPPTRLTIRDNLLDGGAYGVKGPGLATAATFATFAPRGVLGNLVITTDVVGFPPGNFFAASRAMLAADLQLLPTSLFKGKATTGRDPGANIGAVLAATAGVVIP